MTNFLAVSRAKVDANYRSVALSKLKELSVEAQKSGATSVRIGTVQTGANAGNVLAMQFFDKMSDIENVYDMLAESSIYQELISSGNFEINGRALLQMHHRENRSEESKYMMLTKFEGATIADDEAKSVLDVFMDNGGVACGYATFMLGSFVGQRLMGVRYPSMEAVQQAYAAVSASTDYQSTLSKAKLHFRNLIRLA